MNATFKTLSTSVSVWVVLLFLFARTAIASGPPYIPSGNVLLVGIPDSWTYDNGDGTFTTITGTSYYRDTSGVDNGTYWFVSDDNQLLQTSAGYSWWGSYNPSTGQFSNGMFAVSEDQMTLVGAPLPLTVLANTPSGYLNPTSNWWNPSYEYIVNGVAISAYSIPQNSIFQIGISPWYCLKTVPTRLDLTQDMPSSNIFNAPPQQIYINGKTYSIDTVTQSVSGTDFSDSITYVNTTTGLQAGINRYFADGVLTGGDIWGSVDTVSFTGSFNPSSWSVENLTRAMAISFSGSSSAPAYGPVAFSWNNAILGFQYTTSDNKDWYHFSDGAAVDYSVLVGSDGSVVTTSPASFVGTFNASAHQLNWQGEAPSNLYALDENGNPIGLPVGITFLFGSDGPGHTLLGFDGVIYSPGYTYRRTDGSWGMKYFNLPDGVYLVQDENNNYTAPPYKFASSSGDTVVNAIIGWPATTIYPTQLFINGILCTMVAGSQYDSGAGLPRNGGVSYRASAYDLTVVLSWSWDTQFHGYVTGKYGQSSSFKGAWDGVDGFTNMTDGAVVTLSPPSTTPPASGPPQVAINGTAFTFDPTASGANPNGADVYQGPLGMSLTVDGNNVATLYGAGGATLATGTYNPTTHQFNFGSGNTVNLGSGNTGVVTATDTNGHNLATATGGSTNGGVTELAGGLDVRGNAFTLGTWTATNGESLYGFSLTYSDGQPGLLGLSTTRSAVNWLWTHPSTDGGTDQVTALKLDSTHRLLLYDPNNPSNAGVVIDPAGGSGFHGPVRTNPAGDISMGDFHSGPTPP